MSKRGSSYSELFGMNIVPTKKNDDERRVNMYRDYMARELPIPYHLADNEEELSKYSTEAIYDIASEPDTLDDIDFESLGLETLE